MSSPKSIARDHRINDFLSPYLLMSTDRLWPQSKMSGTKYRDHKRITLPDGMPAEVPYNLFNPWIVPKQEWVLIPLEPKPEPE